MGVYTKLIPDSQIKNCCIGYDAVVILGCGACTNESLAYQKKDGLISEIRIDSKGQTFEFPLAVNNEMERISSMLENIGHTVRAMHVNVYGGIAVCNPKVDSINLIKDEIPLGDVILAICCPAGQLGIKRIIENSIDVLPAVDVVGTLYCHFIKKNGKSIIDKNKCVVCSF